MISKKSKAFTLVELLIVISIIGMLSVLISIGLRSIRARAQDVQRRADFRSISNALQRYSSDNSERFPISKKNTTDHGPECLAYDPSDLSNYNKTSPIGKALVEGGHISKIPKTNDGKCCQYFYNDGEEYILSIPSNNPSKNLGQCPNGPIDIPSNPGDPNDIFAQKLAYRLDGTHD